MLKKSDRVTPLICRLWHAAFMTRPAPISLRIRSAEATHQARAILKRLNEADLLQRRVRWAAVKALVAIREMNSVAVPKLKSMRSIDREQWRAEFQLIESKLEKICKRGVR